LPELLADDILADRKLFAKNRDVRRLYRRLDIVSQETHVEMIVIYGTGDLSEKKREQMLGKEEC
jgi:hypothetical protein